MPFLNVAEQLAAERGYLDDPVVLAFLPTVPAWFRALGTPAGQAAFEQARGFALPAALREFYERHPLACFLQAAIDGDIFSAGFEGDEPHPPPVLRWGSGIHVAFAYHWHSGMVCAAAVDSDDPLVAWGSWGFEDEVDDPVGHFSEWVYRIVEGHERMLDALQSLYASRENDFFGIPNWVLQKPGMQKRLAR
jgi:hypothetical protein